LSFAVRRRRANVAGSDARYGDGRSGDGSLIWIVDSTSQ
jgi:hypothetical protein